MYQSGTVVPKGLKPGYQLPYFGYSSTRNWLQYSTQNVYTVRPTSDGRPSDSLTLCGLPCESDAGLFFGMN